MQTTGNEQTDLLIGQRFDGNVIPHTWYQKITNQSGKPDTVSILILSDILYWYRPSFIRDEYDSSEIQYKKKYHGDLLQKSYKNFNEQFGFSEKQIRESLKRLESLGLCKRIYRTIETEKFGYLPNTMFIEIDARKIIDLTYGQKEHRTFDPSPKGNTPFPKRKHITENTTNNLKDSNYITEFHKTPEPKPSEEHKSVSVSDTVEDLAFQFLSEVESIRAEHKLNEKYLLTRTSIISSINEIFKPKESETNATVTESQNKELKEQGNTLQIPCKNLFASVFRPLPEFSVLKRTDKTSLLKIYLAYIKYYERFPTETEIKWIQKARKGAKKPFSPSDVENALALAIKDDFRDGFVDKFTTYLWNAKTNYAQPKKPIKKESAAAQLTIIGDFSDFE